MSARKPPAADPPSQLFSAIVTDIPLRDTQETMEVPFLSLSKRPRFEPIEFKHGDLEIAVSGGKPYGIANIWDWDLMMWLLSQVRQALDKGETPSRRIRFCRSTYLRAARRQASGTEYRRLEATIARLKNTTVVTTIRPQNRRTIMFSWIEYADIERDEKGRMRDALVVLPEWLFHAVCNHRMVLSMHRDYFLLTGGYERWLYRFIRKTAGTGPHGWKWKLKTLYERSGSTRGFKYFSRDLRKIIDRGMLLDYRLSAFPKERETWLHACKAGKPAKSSASKPQSRQVDSLRLDLDTFEKAKRVAAGYDVYELERRWRQYNQGKESRIARPDAAFVGYCRSFVAKNPLPVR